MLIINTSFSMWSWINRRYFFNFRSINLLFPNTFTFDLRYKVGDWFDFSISLILIITLSAVYFDWIPHPSPNVNQSATVNSPFTKKKKKHTDQLFLGNDPALKNKYKNYLFVNCFWTFTSSIENQSVWGWELNIK